jgi:predicted ATPase
MLFDGSSVMLLEQPEDSLHQGLTKKVIGLLRQNAEPSQLILSSHSSALLNKLKPEEIRLVSLHEGFTTVRQLDQRELTLADSFLSQEGPLYDFLETVQED